MRKIMYNLALFILHKNAKRSYFHDVIEKELFKSFHVLEKMMYGKRNRTIVS